MAKGKLERATGIEPAYTAWKAVVLPLNYARTALRDKPPAHKPDARLYSP